MTIVGLDHVQVAAPPGCEEQAGAYFGDLLGMRPVGKPPALEARGGAWFQAGDQQIHVGVTGEFAPAVKAHPGFLVSSAELDRLAEALSDAGYPAAWDESIPGLRRFYSQDPWGNRIEFVEDGS